MDLLLLDPDVTVPAATHLVAAVNGWTDAGGAGSAAGELLRASWPTVRLGELDPDRIFRFDERRPSLPINRGVLGTPLWPSLELHALTVPDGRSTILLLTGSEPDLAWRGLCDELVRIARAAGVTSYLGLGSVPGPVPHTRATRVVATSDDVERLEHHGRQHDQVVVPASFQVILETRLRDAGLATLGLWARIPHYIAADYPEASIALLNRLGDEFGTLIDVSPLDERVEETRERLAAAASNSHEVAEHIEALEALYDADDDARVDGPLPTGDQIAAEFEQFLRGHDDD